MLSNNNIIKMYEYEVGTGRGKINNSSQINLYQ